MLEISSGKGTQHIDYFKPIKNELIHEKIYIQILYEKSNIIVNLEMGQNADLFEGSYLTKTAPVKFQKIVRTAIIKNGALSEKVICEEKINEPITAKTVYKTLNETNKKCRTAKQL